VLFEQFARDEGEVIKLALHGLLFIIIHPELVFQLLLIIEEEELVLEYLTAAHLHVLFVGIAVSHSCQVFAILLDLSVALRTLLHHVLAHLTKMILK